MKEQRFVLIIILLFAFFLLFAACSEDDSTDPGSFISFKVDGVAKLYRFGYLEPEYGGQAFGNMFASGRATVLIALSESIYLTNSLAADYLMTYFDNVMGGGGMFVAATNARMQYRDTGTNYVFVTNYLSISSFGDVGGYLVGSFSATIYANGTTVTNFLTDGVIHVKRIADDTYMPN